MDKIPSRRCERCKEFFTLDQMRKYRGYFYCLQCYIWLVPSKSLPKSIASMFNKEMLRPDEKKNKIEPVETKTKILEESDIHLPTKINIPQVLELSEETKNQLFFTKPKTEITPEYEKAYKNAIEELQQKLSHTMLGQALGYQYIEEKIISIKNPDDSWMEVKKEITKKHQPGNSQLFIMFMTNKFPDLWKVSKELVHNKGEGYDSEPSQRDRKKVIALARELLTADTSKY